MKRMTGKQLWVPEAPSQSDARQRPSPRTEVSPFEASLDSAKESAPFTSGECQPRRHGSRAVDEPAQFIDNQTTSDAEAVRFDVPGEAERTHLTRKRATSSEWARYYARADQARRCLGDPFQHVVESSARRRWRLRMILTFLTLGSVATLVLVTLWLFDNVNLESEVVKQTEAVVIEVK